MNELARQLSCLVTQSASSVAQAAAAWKSKGNRVYPIHLGDINIQTTPHIVETTDRALADGYQGDCPRLGMPQLRKAPSEDIDGSRGISYSRNAWL
ncbi:hypothetical protein [Pseudarthrobacter chlorophenolicus]|uniref:hypothetical protein n=1 Tax=Pseudarthrobacter chlorophenolicus TaxID=85085 RepID=UPI0006818679|nr:hypothetical protein [Pseudarthrobacter chlorophenolicus]